ncbi:uncharacterized protein LOC116298086 [Actinia tenebrosa]|uniref:Uncharacterized protein LOC116298086 n=1 Tax=Actinia tenebrosa TaxID=6105 RepID=A0A6P8I149_ACTTE|nr:uncharacterized protein LOC116298086 [Actinia tenebrosa]
MLAGIVLGLFAGLFCTCRTGESIKCYSYFCSNHTTTPHPTCAPPKVITCQMEHNSLIPPDRCMIQRVIGEPGSSLGIQSSVHHEIRGCANHLECRMSRLCEEAKNHGNIKQCQTTCCEGDLCNREGPVARQVVEPEGPKGSDLYCYACSNVTEPGQVPGINCSHPIRQRCGIDPLTGHPQDRCLTIVMSRKLQRPMGKVLYQEIRNCSSTHYCSHSFCSEANRTGTLTTCKADCCTSNMCNKEGILIPNMASTVRPITAVTEDQGDKLAREGIPPSFPPTKEAKPTGASPEQSCFKLKTLLGIFAAMCMLLG